ncbi:MAG: stage V sporulation protein AC [Ruminococcus sp.]|jgi:stage V sporulation protein AC|nr:stage V sporulation protein AC [Ruminococcus sp.]
MTVSKASYGEMVKRASPNSKAGIDTLKAFAVGGLICSIGEALRKLYEMAGFAKDDVALLTAVTLIFLSAILTGFGLYNRLAKHAGAGTLVPITGFANAVVSPALEFKSEGFVLGVGAKIFAISGPVILYGIAASFIYGVIYFFIK